MKPLLQATAVVLVMLLTGCASYVSGTKQKITVTSTPSGAKVTVTDWNKSIVIETNTPAAFTLKRAKGYFAGAKYTVRLEAAGYCGSNSRLQPTMNGWYVGNILFGGLLGFVFIDPATGAMWAIEPKNLNITLQPEANQAPTGQ